MIVVLGEIGGAEEHGIADAIREKKLPNQLLHGLREHVRKSFHRSAIWTCWRKIWWKRRKCRQKMLPFVKRALLFPIHLMIFGKRWKKPESLVQKGDIVPQPEPEQRGIVAEEYATAKKKESSKTKRHHLFYFVHTGEEATYLGEPISSIVEDKTKGWLH